jgi:hypothetical protein
MNTTNIAKLEEKRKELVEFITLHDSDITMKEDYSHTDSILTRQLSYISKYYNGDTRIQKLDHGSVNRYSHNAENLYFSLAMYPDLFQKILEKANYEIIHIDVAKKGGVKETKNYIRLTDIASTTQDCIWYRIKPDFIDRLCSARDLLKQEIKKEIEDLTNEIEGGVSDKEELQLPSFKLEDKVIVVTEYIDHDMFWIKDVLKTDMKLNISADSSEEEIETAMCGRVVDMYLDEMIQDAINKNTKEREELLKSVQPLPAKEKIQWLWQKMKINIAMTKIDKKLD